MQFTARLRHALWQQPLSAYSWSVKPLVWLARCARALGRDLMSGEIGLRSMSLVYTTLLSLVPLLAFSFSLLKGFGVHNQVEPLLLNLLEPLGEGGVRVTEQIMLFVGNIKVGVLGSVGLGVLLYTVTSLIHKMIKAIDFTWNGRGERSFLHRLGIYMLMIMLGPLILFSVAGAVSSAIEVSWIQGLLETRLIGGVYAVLIDWMPVLLVVVMLSLIYWVLPGEQVQWYSALAGGVLAALLWKFLGWVFATVVVGSAKYTAIYSAFASALLFMIWLHLSWLVLLLGSRFVYYLEHPWNMRAGGCPQAASTRRMLDVLYRIVSGFYRHSGGVTSVELVCQLGIGEDQLEMLIQPLRARGIVLRTGDASGAYLPARSPDQILLADVVELVHDWHSGDAGEEGPEHPAVTALLARLDQSVRSGLAGQTLADWVRQSG